LPVFETVGRSTEEGSQVEADREDAARLCRGDTSGLAGLMSRHQARLFRYLLRLVGDTSVAEDVFQQTWLNVAERIRRYDASRPFGPWLVTLARNLALDQLRRRKPSSLDEIDEPEAPASGSDPLEQAMARQSAARVEAALGALGPLDREVLTLRFEDDLELNELAATLEVPLPTAKARLYRALERLRRGLLSPTTSGGRR
jgi:RNA polymerase sigma-70 factor (ECF subfamily)